MIGPQRAFQVLGRRTRRAWDVHVGGGLEPIRSLHDVHAGQRAFLIGNGPSVRNEDLERLRGEVTFCFNRFHLAYPKLSFRPTYTLVSDTEMVDRFGAEIGARSAGGLLIASAYRPRHLGRDFVWTRLRTRDPFEFVGDATDYLSPGGSVVVVAAQLAWYMGIREVYLYGVDHRFRFERIPGEERLVEGEGNHFISDYRSGKPWYRPEVDAIERALEASRDFYDAGGGMLCNATRGGDLESIQRVPFGSLFPEPKAAPPAPVVEQNPRNDSRFARRFKPGHFYSPLPSYQEIDEHEERLFKQVPRELPGIEMDVPSQLELLEIFSKRFLPDMPAYGMEPIEDLRFHHKNSFYSSKDATVLHCMLRHLRPRHVIEVGSGFSSAMLLDTNERFFDREIELTFVEPNPERLYENIRRQDREVVEIHEAKVQDVPLEIYQQLEPHDILFIDSSHVTKIGSDVNHLLFEVLPSLRDGVFIHFHDIFHPFEYLQSWVEEGRAWNEAYLLRAFLQYNTKFRIRFFTSYLLHFHPEHFEGSEWARVPQEGSRSSLWLEKVAS